MKINKDEKELIGELLHAYECNAKNKRNVGKLKIINDILTRWYADTMQPEA